MMTEAGHARRCTDHLCGTVQFPRTDPVVIMLIHREGQCLLGRAIRAQRYPPGLHSCLAGYVEPGESIEEAVRRRARRIRMAGSRPDLMLIDGGTTQLGAASRALAQAELELLRIENQAEVARSDHAPQRRRRREVRITELGVQSVEDRERGVEADEVEQRERAHREPELVEHVVDLRRGGDAFGDDVGPLREKLAVVTYDDGKTEVAALTQATANMGFPSRPKE